MFFNDLKLKFFFVLTSIILFYFTFKIVSLVSLLRTEKKVTKALKKKYILVKKKNKDLQESYWNLRYKNSNYD